MPAFAERCDRRRRDAANARHGGQAFTQYPEGMALVEEAFAQRSVLPPRQIRVTAFGNRVQEVGAGVVSLGGLYADPIGAMRRAGRRDATA